MAATAKEQSILTERLRAIIEKVARLRPMTVIEWVV